MRYHFIFLVLSTILLSCSGNERKARNVATFAKLYGYSRWFHPSDEAQEIDWNKFAVHGIQRIEKVKSDLELRDSLLSLFSPIVPGLQIYKTNEKTQFDASLLRPSDTLGAKKVSWQHFGVNLGEESNIYKSIRTNRPQNDSFTLANKWLLEISSFKGKDLRLSAYLRTKEEQLGGKAFLFLLPIEENNVTKSVSSLVSNNAIKIKSADWREFNIECHVSDNALYVIMGCAVQNDIQVWADEFVLSVKEDSVWKLVSLENSGFESDDNMADLGEWYFDQTFHRIDYSTNNPYKGNFSLHIDYTGKMFENAPEFGEIIEKPIGTNLSCHIPLSLYSMDLSTFPSSDSIQLEKLKSGLSKIKLSTDYDFHINLASLIISWNIFQHFYPYFDVVNTDWDRILLSSIESTYTCENRIEFFKILTRLVAELDDGHGAVFGESMYHLPVRTEITEDKIVVTGSSSLQLKTGDVIRKVDGVEALEVHKEMMSMVSGSPQLKQHRALNVFGSSYRKVKTSLIIERQGEKMEVGVQKTNKGKSIFFNSINDWDCSFESVLLIEPGIYYVNLGNCTEEQLEKYLMDFANAKAVIYDFRWGSKFLLTDLLSHMVDTTVFTTWMEVPQFIYPDQESTTFEKFNWSLKPESPHFNSKSIFINAPSVVSYGETIMGIIDHYQLAEMVGEPTAGCNGNINRINLPCGYQIMWTGMKVMKHDGSQLHLIGFEPNHPVRRTLKGVQEREDEALNTALELARQL